MLVPFFFVRAKIPGFTQHLCYFLTDIGWLLSSTDILAVVIIAVFNRHEPTHEPSVPTISWYLNEAVRFIFTY